MIEERDFLPHFFSELNEQKIAYCVLRNYQKLPYTTGESDLDILIGQEDAHSFLEILDSLTNIHNGKIVSYIASHNCPRICVLGTENGGWGLMIDLHYDEITFRGHLVLTNEIVWKNTFLYNDCISALNKKADALIGLLKELLNNGICAEYYFIEFKQHALEKSFLDIVFLAIKKPNLSTLLMAYKDEPYSQSSMKLLAQKLQKEFPLKRTKNLHFAEKFKRLLKQPGYTIAFLGVDGAGKSTLIDKITKPLNATFHNKVFYEHMRPNYFPSIAQLLNPKTVVGTQVNTNPHGEPSSRFFGSLMRWSYYMLDYTLGFGMKVYKVKAIRSCVWLFDRYYYDYFIDSKRARIKLPHWILKFGQLIIPEPDLILCLGTEPQIIHNRKPELSLKEVERQVLVLKKFCNANKRAVWIETGKSIEASHHAVLQAIIERMANRFESIKLY